jgi:GNAT superfamily N-acetyltransferase
VAKTKTATDAIVWRRAQDALLCDRIEPWAHGSVLRTPSAPDFWDANTVRVESAGLSAAAMMAAADELQADCRHRKLDVEHEPTGAAARPAFAAAGWMAERLAMMCRLGPPPAAHASVEEVPLAATRALRIAWSGDDAADAEAFARSQEPVLERRAMRAFMERDIGFAMLAVGADGVEIDQLYVTPAARGRGVGARLMETALAAGSSDVAWIVADDEGRPRQLYERLGFRTVWHPHGFVRRPS